jgi:pheromone a factor receptor
MRLFIARRYQLARLLEASKSAVSTSRFIRLMALSSLQIGYAFPVALALRTLQFIDVPLNTYTNWQNVHFGFNYVGTVTLEQLSMSPKPYRQLSELSQWGYAIPCVVFFIFFGLGEESVAAYRSWAARISDVFRSKRLATWTATGSRCVSRRRLSLTF